MRGTSLKGLLDPKEVAMTRRQFVGMAALLAVALVGPATISTRARVLTDMPLSITLRTGRQPR